MNLIEPLSTKATQKSKTYANHFRVFNIRSCTLSHCTKTLKQVKTNTNKIKSDKKTLQKNAAKK